MIALTQEKREELIAHAKEVCERVSDYCEQTFPAMTKQLMEISLASLTALPCGYTYNRGYHAEVLDVDLNDDVPIGVDLFTAPPVPEIKFPEKLNAGEIHYELAEKYGLDVSIDQLERGLAEEVYSVAANNFKRLNGLGE